MQLYDETPPAVPVKLTGKIDSTGIVRLEWKANTKKDLGGYHVLFDLLTFFRRKAENFC